jgi:hypothetical protein
MAKWTEQDFEDCKSSVVTNINAFESKELGFFEQQSTSLVEWVWMLHRRLK